jgi:tRNA G18 (ribose-2'-O)-methylase SpoU
VRGYFGIGIFAPKNEVNIGGLWRSAYIFGAAFIFTIGRRYKNQPADTLATPRHIPLLNYLTYEDFREHAPSDCQTICVENNEGAVFLARFRHPERAIYLLGAEDNGLPAKILDRHQSVIIESERPFSLNVATAGTIVMYDRFIKRGTV